MAVPFKLPPVITALAVLNAVPCKTVKCPVLPEMGVPVIPPDAVSVPDVNVKLLAVTLPILRLANPELLMVPVVAPVSVVIKPEKALSDSRQIRAALTAP